MAWQRPGQEEDTLEGGVVLPYSLGRGVHVLLGSQKSYPLLDQILRIL